MAGTAASAPQHKGIFPPRPQPVPLAPGYSSRPGPMLSSHRLKIDAAPPGPSQGVSGIWGLVRQEGWQEGKSPIDIPAADGCEWVQEPQAGLGAVQPNPRDLPPKFASRLQRRMLAGPLRHSSSKAPNCDGKIVFSSHFAEGARHKGEQAVGQGQEQDLSPGLGVGIAPSCGGQHLLHSPTRTSLTSRYVHAAS